MRVRTTRLLSGLAILTVAVPVHASPPPVLSAADRAAASNRPLAVSLTPGIAPSIDVGRVVSDAVYGGGLIGALILSSTDKKRQLLAARAEDRAHSAIAPLTAALAGTDFSELALVTSRKAMARVDGFDPAAIALVANSETSADMTLMTAHPSGQTGKIAYRLQMSPDFTEVQLIADLTVVRSRGMAPIYAQRIVSVVQLKQRSYVHEENVARWSREDGRVARQAVTAAFARIETAIPVVINLDSQRYAVVTDKTKTTSALAAGFYGPLLFRDERGPVIWSKGNGFIALQTARD